MSFQTNNFLQRNKFGLVIPSFEGVRFLSNEVAIPAMELPSTSADSPLSRMALAGDKVRFSPIAFQFFVDEEMINYKSIYDWLMGIGYVESHTSYSDYQAKVDYEMKLAPPKLGEQDISVVILNSKENPVATFTFLNAIPISLSLQAPFQTGVTSIEPVMATVMFDYDHYKFDLT